MAPLLGSTFVLFDSGGVFFLDVYIYIYIYISLMVQKYGIHQLSLVVLSRYLLCFFTSLKINMEHVLMEVWFRWVSPF